MCGRRLSLSSAAKQTRAAQCQRDATGLEAAHQPINHVVYCYSDRQESSEQVFFFFFYIIHVGPQKIQL
jgi:hypothetical protein